MPPITHVLTSQVPAPIEAVFSLLTDPAQIENWLPYCDGVDGDPPLRKGKRLQVYFGKRETEFEVVEFTPPSGFGWVEHGQRQGSRTYFQLRFAGGTTTLRIKTLAPHAGFGAWVRARFFPRRRVALVLDRTVQNLRRSLAR